VPPHRIWILYWVFCVVSLLCLQNTLMDIDFDILKYIKELFKVSTSVYFEGTTEASTKQFGIESELLLITYVQSVKFHFHHSFLFIMQIPFCVVIGWIMGNSMDLNFQLFETAALFLTVIVVAFMLQVCVQRFTKE